MIKEQNNLKQSSDDINQLISTINTFSMLRPTILLKSKLQPSRRMRFGSRDKGITSCAMLKYLQVQWVDVLAQLLIDLLLSN